MCAAILSGPILTKKFMLNQSERKIYILIKFAASLFLVFAFLSTLRSYNINSSIFGDNFRRNGFLTIISFVLIFFGAIKFIRLREIYNLFNTVLLTSTIVGGYALIQITKNDLIMLIADF